MTTKGDFEHDEWTCVLSMPWLAGLLVIFADPSVRMLGEFKAMTGAITRGEQTDGPAGALIDQLVADMDDDDIGRPEGSDDDEEAIVEMIARGRDIVDATCTTAEAMHVKRWVNGVARATAGARKEGGFLGIGAVRVSDAEREALEHLEDVLHL